MQEEDTYTITGKPLRPHEYVIIKREMTARDDRAIKNHAAQIIQQGSNAKDAKMLMTIGDTELATVKQMVVGWNLTRTRQRQDGSSYEESFPYSKENVENLRRPVYVYILAEINRLNSDEEEESPEGFLPDADASSITNSNGTNPVPSKP